MPKADLEKEIADKLSDLSEYELDSIHRLIQQLQRPKTFWRNPKSDIVTDGVLNDFGDALRMHHVTSAEALSKDRFEYALERVLVKQGVKAERAPRGNPGHDLTIGTTPVSLKTQADKNIKESEIHISKFMELGKGDWTDKPEQLNGLLERFYAHMTRYERIFTLRRLKDAQQESYELVEIPKDLLSQAKLGTLTMNTTSKQMPKPGRCILKTKAGEDVFELYFDGGTERKLQVQHLNKKFCIVHATWKFPRPEADKVPVATDDSNE